MVISRYVCFMMYHLCKNERKVLSNYHNNRINNFNNMEKKNLLFVAAAMVMAGCASDDMIGDNNATQSDNQVIGFNMSTPAMTRGSSSDATKLGNMFIVWGEKNETQTSSVKASEENKVFQNYVVKHDVTSPTGSATSNYSAGSTTSNTNGWEYVGIDHSDFDNNVKSTIGSGKAQTIKYWDDNASSYTFTAVSALQTDIKDGNVIIEKIVGTDTEDATKSVYDKGYTIQVKSNASTGNIFYADRLNIAKDATTGYTHNPVELTFRSFESKVRFGIYENIRGYHVVITDVKYNNGTSHTTTSGESNGPDKFGVDGSFIVAGDDTKYTVTYENATSNNPNKVKVKADASNTQGYFVGGTGILSTTETQPLGTAANAPTWDKGTTADPQYTAILPNPGNKTNMKLTISYKLISDDTKEVIVVENKTAEVPAEYCQWKSNYAYSYIFKISDKSADLYPITFDAVVVDNQIGNQETITTVSEPSITTFAYDATSKVYKTGADEYVAGYDIYATVVEGSKVVALDKTDNSGNVKLYTVTTSDATNFPITEASVADALEKIEAGTAAISTNQSNLPILNVKPQAVTNTYSTTTSVPVEDGTMVTLSNNGAALTWKPAAAATYAIEYKKTKDANGNALTTPIKYYKIVKVVAQ